MPARSRSVAGLEDSDGGSVVFVRTLCRVGPELYTDRLLLRRWREDDREPFAAMNADPDVMHHFPGVRTRSESDDMIDRIEAGFAIWGFGLWAVEALDGRQFIGFVGLNPVAFPAHFTPAIEIGWRLRQSAWGRGYATEAAREVLRFGFEEARLDQIVSFTIPANTASVAVMERLGMRHDPDDDFDHPGLPPDSPLRRHVLYRMEVERWRG